MTPTDPAERLADALADRYRLERELGQGGMATVYLARDLKHERDVALKVMRPELAAGQRVLEVADSHERGDPMRKSNLAVALAIGVVASAVKASSADAQTYGSCLQAASYQLAESIDCSQQPGSTIDFSACWDTFYFLRDDVGGCEQFGAAT